MDTFSNVLYGWNLATTQIFWREFVSIGRAAEVAVICGMALLGDLPEKIFFDVQLELAITIAKNIVDLVFF
jgi:hypothetical protein